MDSIFDSLYQVKKSVASLSRLTVKHEMRRLHLKYFECHAQLLVNIKIVSDHLTDYINVEHIL